MKLTWINHSSFLLEHGRTSLLCDPWIDGQVFDNSWSLLTPTRFSYADFNRVTHIWFSHEHPDHFFPPNLQKIPPEIRKKITVLFQATAPGDGRVQKYCKDLGFKTVLELHNDWHQLDTDFQVLCQPVDRGDSWLVIRAAGKVLLNLNDCIYLSENDLIPVRQRVGDVDLLITQFSYASWWGNPTEDDRWRNAAQQTLCKIRREVSVLHPTDVLLSASYVFFCHQENSYMNKHMNRVSRAYQFVLDNGKTRPIILYPGDEWVPGTSWDSSVALSRYEADYDRAVNNSVRVSSSTVPLGELLTAGNIFANKLQRINSAVLWRRLPTATINVTDHQVSLLLNRGGVRVITRLDDDEHDIALSSSALLYCLRFPWGGETLMINGRFYSPAKGDRRRFFRWFSIAQSNNRGTYYDRAYYAEKIFTRVRKLI